MNLYEKHFGPAPAWLVDCPGRVVSAIVRRFGRLAGLTVDEVGSVPICEWMKQKGIGGHTVKDIREVLARQGVAMAGCPHRLHGDGT